MRGPHGINEAFDVDPVITPAQRVMRRAGAVILALVVLLIGGGLLFLTAVDGGKGYQVAPVLAVMVLVMFGFPAVAVLIRHIQAVWLETQ